MRDHIKRKVKTALSKDYILQSFPYSSWLFSPSKI